jgi:acetyl esterase
MEVGLAHLIENGSAAHVEESRTFNLATQGAASGREQPDPATSEGLQKARSTLTFRPPDPRAVERVARAGGRQVPVRTITPRQGPARAACLEVHGGGFYLSSAARSDSRNVVLADTLGMVMVSVDYRLAPEHPWPAAPDDCETAALWLVEEAEDLFGTGQLLITGLSAGATLAMTTLLRLRNKGRSQAFTGAVLQFGAYDLSGQSPSGRAYADEWLIRAYAGHVADRTNPDVSPLYGDLHGLQPTLLVVGALDLLLEDSLAMAARLSAAGNEVDLRVFPESPHGFTSFPTAMATAALDSIESWLAG